MDVSDDEPTLDDEKKPEPEKRERKKRSDAGRSRGSRGGGSRFDRRAERAQKTIAELLALGKPDLDVDGLSFLEVVDRDVAAWGRFFAQLGEWFAPFGSMIDVFFGSPLVVLLNMAPSVRAARRDLRARREARAAERAAEIESAERIADEDAEREHAARMGVFAEVPAGMSREDWLAGGGGSGAGTE